MADRELSLPFRIDSRGNVATTDDPDVRARQHLTSYLLTVPGERVMRGDFGSVLRHYTFENLDPLQLELLRERVSRSVARDVVDARLENLEMAPDSVQAALRVAVEFSLAQGPSGSSTTRTTVVELRGGDR